MADPVKALQRRMLELKLKQAGMGALVGLSQPTMCRILNRKVVPPFKAQVRLDKDHGIPVEWWPDPRAEYLKKKARKVA